MTIEASYHTLESGSGLRGHIIPFLAQSKPWEEILLPMHELGTRILASIIAILADKPSVPSIPDMKVGVSSSRLAIM